MFIKTKIDLLLAICAFMIFVGLANEMWYKNKKLSRHQINLHNLEYNIRVLGNRVKMHENGIEQLKLIDRCYRLDKGDESVIINAEESGILFFDWHCKFSLAVTSYKEEYPNLSENEHKKYLEETRKNHETEIAKISKEVEKYKKIQKEIKK